MTVGETKEIQLAPADAYGEHDERGVQEVPVANLPEGVEVGTQLQTQQGVHFRRFLIYMNHFDITPPSFTVLGGFLSKRLYRSDETLFLNLLSFDRSYVSF